MTEGASAKLVCYFVLTFEFHCNEHYIRRLIRSRDDFNYTSAIDECRLEFYDKYWRAQVLVAQLVWRKVFKLNEIESRGSSAVAV